MISLPHFGEALQACLESLTQQSVADGDFCYAGPRLSRDSSVHGAYGGGWEREWTVIGCIYPNGYICVSYICHAHVYNNKICDLGQATPHNTKFHDCRGKIVDYRDQSRYAPSEWETSLWCNDISHWLSAYLDWSLRLWLIVESLSIDEANLLWSSLQWSNSFLPQSHPTTGPIRFLSPVRFLARKAEWSAHKNFTSVLFSWSH